MLAHLKDTSEWRLLWLQKLGSQVGVATENLGVVRTSSLTFWPCSASDNAEFVHMQRIYKFFLIKSILKNKKDNITLEMVYTMHMRNVSRSMSQNG